MKHGDKKAKSAKASVKNASPKGAPQKSGKAAEAKAAGKKPPAPEAKGRAAKAGAKTGSKTGSQAAHDIGARTSRNGGDPGTFGNSAIASAFKRAVKKYPNAFRRLTD